MNDSAETPDPQTAEVRRLRRQERRRRAQERRFDASVPSPCIAVCQLDPKGEVCIGCYRNLDEIRDWPIMTADEKRATLARIAARKGESAE